MGQTNFILQMPIENLNKKLLNPFQESKKNRYNALFTSSRTNSIISTS